MTGLRKYPPAIDFPEWNDLVDYLGGITAESQINTLKILLAGAGSTLLSSWQHPDDKTKIDSSKLYPTVLTLPLSSDLDFAGYNARNILIDVLGADPSSPAAGQIWYRSDLEKLSLRRASVTDRIVLESLAQILANKTLASPTIADFTNAIHDHLDAAGGGLLDADAVVFTTDDLLDAVARLQVSKAASPVGTRRGLNFIEGSNVTLTLSDDPNNERVNVTIAASGGGGGGSSGLWQNCVTYPWAGTAVLSADPLYSYTSDVSDGSGVDTEVGWFDFDLPTGTIKSIFANLVWACKVTGSGNGLTRWQLSGGSHASPDGWVDITDEITQSNTAYDDFARSGVFHKITGLTTTTPFTVRCLVKNSTASSTEGKVKSNTYFRVTYKVS
jgi:hypothetical protein